jgi:hypothetical protein
VARLGTKAAVKQRNIKGKALTKQGLSKCAVTLLLFCPFSYWLYLILPGCLNQPFRSERTNRNYLGRLPIRKNGKPEPRGVRLAVNAFDPGQMINRAGHFMERMNFNRTPISRKMSNLVSPVDRFGADLNAYTGFDERCICFVPTTVSSTKGSLFAPTGLGSYLDGDRQRKGCSKNSGSVVAEQRMRDRVSETLTGSYRRPNRKTDTIEH